MGNGQNRMDSDDGKTVWSNVEWKLYITIYLETRDMQVEKVGMKKDDFFHRSCYYEK